MVPDFDKYLNEFENNTISAKYARWGMFYSEAFIFSCFCKHYDVDIILESGTCLGAATNMLALALPSVQIYTFDTETRGASVNAKSDLSSTKYQEARNKLNKLNNVEAFIGDGCKKLPEFVKNNQNKKIALLIDGPKGQSANQLARKCLDKQNVKFAGIHDQSFPENQLQFYCTQSSQKYSFLDKRQDTGHPVPLHKYPKGPGLCIYWK